MSEIDEMVDAVFDVEITAYCSCGEKIEGHSVSASAGYPGLIVKVPPCKRCMDASHAVGFRDHSLGMEKRRMDLRAEWPKHNENDGVGGE